jgi:hypothetical protein
MLYYHSHKEKKMQDTQQFQDPHRAHAGIHPNSTKSYEEEKLAGHVSSFRKMVFECYARSSSPLSDRDVLKLLDNPDVNNVRPEITRLKHDHLIKEVGRTVCPTTNKTVRICAATGDPYFSRGNKKAFDNSLI